MAEDKTGIYIVTIVALVAIVGLVTLYLNSGMAISLGEGNVAGQATAIEYGGITSGGTIVESGTTYTDQKGYKTDLGQIEDGGKNIASGGTIVESGVAPTDYKQYEAGIAGVTCESC